MPTIYDVAKFAGVSKSTVSLVLNDSPLVKEESKQKVLDAIEKLQYVPNNNARGLSTKTTHCLGIVIMSEKSPVISYDFDQHTGICSYNISCGIMSALMDTKYGTIMEQFCSIDNPGQLPWVVQNKRVDGIFIVGFPYDMGMIQKLTEMKFPFVLVGVGNLEEGIDSVRADPGEGVHLGFRHLVDTGHRNICYINCPETFPSCYTRYDALQDISRELGVPVRPDWILNSPQNNGKGAYDIFASFWQAGNRPDAILTANGHLALGAVRYLYEQHVRIPEDISIVAYEDSCISGYATPALTTVNIHKERMGAIAAQCLLDRLQNPPKEAEQIVVPAELVLRDSVQTIL